MVNMHSFPYIENIEKNDIFLKIIQMHFSQIVLHVLKLEAQWAEPVSITHRTNQKKELPMEAMFVNRSGRNEQSI